MLMRRMAGPAAAPRGDSLQRTDEVSAIDGDHRSRHVARRIGGKQEQRSVEFWSTLAPEHASSRAKWAPSPLDPPVMRAVTPDRSAFNMLRAPSCNSAAQAEGGVRS